MLIDKIRIAQLIPHAGDMCLLDAVESWDETHIRCVTATHYWAGNPLRRGGQLGILCGIEYAAQAMAGAPALSPTGSVGRPGGFFANLGSVSCHTDRLDLISGTLL